MSWTAHKTQEQLEEHFDSKEDLEKKTLELAKLINASKHVILFTGAGISTSCGIPDYRGPDGVWTLKAQNKKRTNPVTPIIKALPSPTHMGLVKLMNEKKIHFILSQNVDGLHRKSGIKSEQICELHGNSNVEVCKSCGKGFLRDYSIYSTHNHFTGRYCDKPLCRGPLFDTIINFGENLNSNILEKSFSEASIADLCIVMGSSCTVSPANQIPKIVSEKGKVVICNLQNTPLDSYADLRIFAKSDDIIQSLMKHMKLDIPKFKVNRRVLIGFSEDKIKTDDNTEKERSILFLRSIDYDGTQVSLYDKVTVESDDGKFKQILSEEPFNFVVTDYLKSCSTKPSFTITLEFYGHYGEKPLVLENFTLNTKNQDDNKYESFNWELYSIEYDLDDKKWTVKKEDKEKAVKSLDLDDIVVDYQIIGGDEKQLEGDFKIKPKQNSSSDEIETYKNIAQHLLKTEPATKKNKLMKSLLKGGFSVVPKYDCPHIKQFVDPKCGTFLKKDKIFESPCAKCSDNSENWICLKCGGIFCSRYINGHMQEHFNETEHCICASFSDLSVWCFKCNAYLEHKALNTVTRTLEKLKFE